ncbi:putative TetR family transcriptional regulator [Gordonia araii NBRC 100433]|uniref:Putative TetR family transcriptional regulator n=1 Tax=Gordonia araii NBRC 100433 TaxID=1073574 RepID=G7H4T1_9ACTN|nr:TetR/AcrR family transcriptional regulator [Gordonia araii]NNG98003.1 TetR/AcrR family transcriptional regulator [Gordonia araii NBRC 100433]GAB10856.1 putative TetR family transcriptional regulator [Gordonia araii NBRC 100433]
MARPSKFSAEQILDAARDVVFSVGKDASVALVAAELGGPVGSVYHRFASREELFVALWVRSIRRFHVGLLDALDDGSPADAVLATAMHIPRYCRLEPAEAAAMTLYRWERVRQAPPQRYADEVETLNDDVFAAMARLCTRRYGRATERRRRVLDIAIRQSPYGLVRPYIGPGSDGVPEWMDEVVVTASRAIAALGD